MHLQKKALRRRAFALARERYDALWPILSELAEREQAQAEMERLANLATEKRGKRGGGGRAAKGVR